MGASETVTYTLITKTTVSTTGTAPAGSSATFSQTYSTLAMMTSGNSQTLSLSGYNGYKITNITLSMKSNQSSGAGKLSYSTDGGTNYTYIIGSSSGGVAFNEDSWKGAWSTSFVDISKNVEIEPTSDSNFIIKIAATDNSLYCESYRLTYEKVPSPFLSVDNVDISYNATGGSIAFTVSDPVTGGVMSASTNDSWISLGGETSSPISFTCDANSGTTSRTATVTLTYTYDTNKTVTTDVTITQAAAPVPTHTLTVNATNGSAEITGKTLDSNGKCEIAEGSSVTANATPAEHYTFTSWTATGVTLEDATVNPLIFTMPKNTVTLTANFTEDEKHDVTFSINGNRTKEKVYEGETITFPADPTSINGYAFVGWSESEVTDGNAPTLISTATMDNADKIFYAVYAIRTPGEAKTYTDVLNYRFIGVTGTAYTGWENKKSNSSAVYAGKSSGGYGAIQMNDISPSGIVSTASGGKVVKVALEWNSSTAKGRIIDIYGSNTAYSGSSNLYNVSDRGEKLGSLVKGSTELTIEGSYEYIGIRSNNGALYLDKVEITWNSATPDTYSDYCTTVPTTVSIHVGASKFTSTYYSKYALVVPEGLTAYTFKVNTSNKLEISETIAKGGTIAKNQAVILYGKADTDYDLIITATDGTKDANNVLRGFDEASTTTGGNVYYRLTTKSVDPSSIGFYWGADEGGEFTVSAHKAYVAVNQQLTFGAGARMADIFGFDDANGIKEIDDLPIDDLRFGSGVYTISGQRVSNPKKGLYIVDGRKVMVK